MPGTNRKLAVAGVAIGLVAAAIASRALLASWIPARRAARIDPLAALRHD